MNIWRLSRSELLSTFFPTWIWQGREWSKWRIPKYDPYYWINAHAHPVVSTYYPFHIVSSIICGKIGLDLAFNFKLLLLSSHSIGAFIGWYCLVEPWCNSFIALFGAITFTLSGYQWKQQPCFQYTVAWFPWLLLGISKGSILLSSISFGMILLAGYYPIGIQIALVAGFATIYWKCPPYWVPIGFLIGSVQLVPFLKYLPKTIRANKHDDIGKVPWWHFASLIFPKAFRYNINGVGYWEMSYYVGITPLLCLLYSTSAAYIIIAASGLLMLGLFSCSLPRIPARWSYTFQFGLIWSALSGLNNLNLRWEVLAILCGIQLFDLLSNNLCLLVNHPYAELYQKSSWAFNTKLTIYLDENLNDDRVSGLPYPLFTGHINELRTLGYCGGMASKEMAEWRNDTNPNGSGEHDWFKSNEDSEKLDDRRIIFAYSRKRINKWAETPIQHLYKNPRIS